MVSIESIHELTIGGVHDRCCIVVVVLSVIPILTKHNNVVMLAIFNNCVFSIANINS